MTCPRLWVPLLLLGSSLGAQVSGPRPGLWRADLESPGGALPFGLELRREGGKLWPVIHNGSERIRLRAARVLPKARRLILDLAPYDARLEASWGPGGRSLQGTWIKRKSADQQQRMRWVARLGQARRFPAIETEGKARATTPVLAPRYRVQFARDRYTAVGLFRSPKAELVEGTFLTALGDYRYLAGNQDGRLLRLSTFDGAHAFLFHARILPNGSLKGDFWSSNSWHETFVAQADPKAQLEDPWQLSKGDLSKLSGLRFPDLQGKLRGLDDPEFRGKARLLVVFGSWCPNCKDLTRYMVELDEKFRSKGLRILALAFERSGKQGLETGQLKRYVAMQGIRYPVLLAGLADKKKASEVLPILDRVRSYPTTMFLDAKGRLHGVYTGFSGPATGLAHTRLREQFEKRVGTLLNSAEVPRK